MLVDSHCHLDARAFARDRDEVISRARAAGVAAFVVPATAPGIPDLSGDGLFLAAGCHPYEAEDWEEGRARVEASLPRAVAVGETGLDFGPRCPAGRDSQLRALEAQMDLAARHSLPAILHERESFDDLVSIVREHPEVGGVFHAFHHGPDRAAEVVDAGWHLGLGGMLTYPANDALREAAATAPLERLLLETDAPWLPPQTRRGGRNEPAWMVETAALLADLRGVSADEIATATTANAARLFGVAA